MTTGLESTMQGLLYAIQMEIDGKEFYLRASLESENEVGKKLLESLAVQEDNHRKKFQQIFENLRESRRWPLVTFKNNQAKVLSTIFAEETARLKSKVRPEFSEIDTVREAMLMEDKSYDLYTQRYELSTNIDERQFYEKIAAEEREHKLILLDYFEFINDPVSWYVKAERHSLDGGV
jgi:rubrerythrin